MVDLQNDATKNSNTSNLDNQGCEDDPVNDVISLETWDWNRTDQSKQSSIKMIKYFLIVIVIKTIVAAPSYRTSSKYQVIYFVNMPNR